MSSVISAYPITSEEYSVLENKFEKLCHYQSWQLLRKNSKNNHTNEEEDVVQEMRLALISSACYYKRQVYIEKCLEAVFKYVNDYFVLQIVNELNDLWKNRTRHGANRQKFGEYQESVLFDIVNNYVPLSDRPDRNSPLVLDKKFNTYCKAITWNKQKSIGKKITKEKSFRAGMTSLSEFDYLASI